MFSFLVKAIAISAVIIISGMTGGIIIHYGTQEQPSNVLSAQTEITSTSTPIPIPSLRYVPQLEFRGYPCTEDCSGHEAGYNWAEEKEIKDPDDCGGNSNSFIEGCRAYAEELQEEFNDEYSDNEYFDF